MRPIAAFKRDEDENSSEVSNPGAPDYVDPELAQHSNSEMTAFIRKGKSDAATIKATLSNAPFWPRRKLAVKNIEVGAVIEHNNGELTNVVFSQTAHALSKHEPVVIAYGAGRHIGHSNLLTNQDRDQNQSLFTDSMDLYDAAEILGRMHYAVLNERNHNTQRGAGIARPKRIGRSSESY
ncbi:hypothetical protein [Asticcacaulis benevestitus]|nr:hypothetical protein [Asticcacaulis benevestitus]